MTPVRGRAALAPNPRFRPSECYPPKWNQFDGDQSDFRAGAARSAIQRIGRHAKRAFARRPQRTRGTDLSHQRPGAFTPHRHYETLGASLPLYLVAACIAIRSAPSYGVKSSRSNGSIYPDSTLGVPFDIYRLAGHLGTIFQGESRLFHA